MAYAAYSISSAKPPKEINNVGNKNILISGCSIAGPTLAYWLKQYGFNPTVVERTTELRDGGYKIDIRGVAINIVKQMGLYEQVHKAGVGVKGASLVDDKGRRIGDLPADLIAAREGDDVELMRGDLSKLLYSATRNSCEYIFNNSITALKQSENGVEVSFKRGHKRMFDLVVGADGIHSNVRSLVFGDEAHFTYSYGDYYFALFSAPNHLNLDRWEVLYALPNRLVNIYHTKESKDAKALFVFRAPGLNYDQRDIEQQKQLLAYIYADAGWDTSMLLTAMRSAPDFHFDTVSQIRMPQWSKGPFVLVGDAAYAPSLASGQGTSIALVGAYVLAGELFAAGGNHNIAFTAYETEIRSFIEKNQQLGVNVHDMVPVSKSGLQMRMLALKMLPYLPMKGIIFKKIQSSIRSAANAIKLKKYA